ncbi:MAG: Rnase Y domain-containing protein, partial [Acidobacteriota bacterium]
MTTQHILFNLIVILGLPVGILIGWIVANRFGRNALSRARREADHLLQNAREQSEKIRKLEIAKAKEQWLAERATLEAEYQKRLDSVKNIERAMNRRDAKLRRFEGQLQEREEEIKRGVQSVQDREKAVEARKAEINALVSEYVEKLEKVSGLTVEDAKRQIVANLKKEAEHEAASLIRQIKDDAKRAAELEAQKIVTLAIERVAVDQVAERTSTHFKLPDEGIKGRLIGQEGRNIKVFEEQTGVQLLINNEDPTMVNISGFNPVAREVARQTLSRLVQSGKIHPRRIQDTVTRVRKKINREIIKAGEEAFRYLKLEMAHPEIVKLVGKLKYRTSYGQNVLRHSIEVAELCGSMAAELGLDVQLAKRSGLLHDIGKAID